MMERLYAQQSGEAGAAAGAAAGAGAADAGADAGSQAGGDDVVDAEFEEVKDDKK